VTLPITSIRKLPTHFQVREQRCGAGGLRRLPLKAMEMTKMHNPPHAGEVLREGLADISVTDAARRLGVTRVTLSHVLNGSTGIR